MHCFDWLKAASIVDEAALMASVLAMEPSAAAARCKRVVADQKASSA